jgi:hypothetical protein
MSPLLKTMHSDLGFDPSNLLIPRPLTGERQDIVLAVCTCSEGHIRVLTYKQALALPMRWGEQD